MNERARRTRIANLIVAPFFAMTALAAPQPAAARSDLDAFLERTDKMSVFPQPVRADITIKAKDGGGDEAVLIVDPASNQQFFAIKSNGFRALSPLDWTPGAAVSKTGAKAVAHGADDTYGRVDLRPMEFFSYWAGDYLTAFISDDNRLEKTVTVYAREEVPYILFVVTFDKEKLVPLIAKYYKDQMNNLVRIRKDSDHVMIGSRPRPQKIVVTDYVEDEETTFLISWKTLDAAPADLFRKASFVSQPIQWPDAGVNSMP